MSLDYSISLDLVSAGDLTEDKLLAIKKLVTRKPLPVELKESLVEKAYEAGEKFVSLVRSEVPPGIIGPFALQGAVAAEEGREDIVIFDVSMRIPGSPGTRYTPYSGYMYGNSVSFGERIAMEIQTAVNKNQLHLCVT